MQNNTLILRKGSKKRYKRKNPNRMNFGANPQNHPAQNIPWQNHFPPPAQDTSIHPEPVELNDDNAPKNPMASQQNPDQNAGPSQPKLNLVRPNQIGPNKPEPTKPATDGAITIKPQKKPKKMQKKKKPKPAVPMAWIPSKEAPHILIAVPRQLASLAQTDNFTNTPEPQPPTPTPPNQNFEQNQLPPVSYPTNYMMTPRPQQIRSLGPNQLDIQFQTMLTYSHPKGIPRSFLQRNQAEIAAQNNIQQNIPVHPSATWQNMTSPNQFYHQHHPPAFAPTAVQTLAPTGMQTLAPIGMQTLANIQMSKEINPQIYQDVMPGPDGSDPQNRVEKVYSPTELFDETPVTENQEEREGTESPELCGSIKRLSAFKRLGPLSQPKKPKLTINLMFGKEQAVSREVVDETGAEIYVPVHLREDILSSTNSIVKEYLPYWPWKKNIPVKKQVTIRNSKTVMILEREQMQEEVYDKNYTYVQITIKDYPPSMTKQDVLDLILESVKGKSFVPCFIDFSQALCKFLVIRCRHALVSIHKYGFIIREEGAEMKITISQVDLSVDDVGLAPWTALKKLLSEAYDGESKLNLSAFTVGNDISHFIYYPLYRVSNQAGLVELKSDVVWEYITDLDLSHNRITTIQGFGLPRTMPKLKSLNLSYNCIEKATMLLKCRTLCLRSIWLEGNPLCHDYTDPAEYVKVIRMIFPSITDIDGTKVQRKGEMPKFVKNYCPEDAVCVVDKFLEVFFPLLDADTEQRPLIQDLYDSSAKMTITYRHKLRINPKYRSFASLFLKGRVLEEGLMEEVEGSTAISKLITKWPNIKHDPFTFTVDVMHHDECTTILRVDGIMKLTSDSLAEDEHLIAFTRTLVLQTHDGCQYKIKNEMVFWDEPAKECARLAFQMTAIKTKPLSLKFTTVPDDDLKDKFIDIFMKLTEMNRKPSERCLELKDWNLQHALEYFSRLLKLNSLHSLNNDDDK